jgi:hypothetical protein
VNVQTGAFHCFSCAAKGNSLIDFVMLRDGCDFKQAVQQLGAWDHGNYDVAARAEYERKDRELKWERERIDRAANKLARIEHALWVTCRDCIHECDRVLCAPAPWPEAQWQRAQAASVLRDEYLLSAYTLLSFGPMAERAKYVLNPDKHLEIAAAVRMAGGVRTDSGYWREVVA